MKLLIVVLRDMLKKYGVPNTKIEWANYTNMYAHYDFDRDIIYISTTMNKDNKEVTPFQGKFVKEWPKGRVLKDDENIPF